MIKKLFAQSGILRSIFFPILGQFDFQIRIKHDFTKRSFYLKSWSHKGYWYYGLSREGEEVDRFKELIKKGSNILEVGGHIGHVTQLFESLVSNSGKVLVAEPTKESLFYLKKNVLSSTTILPVAVSDKIGKLNFFTEHYGGYTNSLVEDFTSSMNTNLSITHRTKPKSIKKTEVDSTTIDQICKDKQYSPNFIKIDVEGAEYNVLIGGKETLQSVDSLMVEISRSNQEVYNFLYGLDFRAIHKDGNPVKKNDYPSGNIFFIK